MFLVATLTLFAASGLVRAFPLSNATLYGRVPPAQVITSCSVPDTAALTFDDGPYIYLTVRTSFPLLRFHDYISLSHRTFPTLY
jgi:hypothetical protein